MSRSQFQLDRFRLAPAPRSPLPELGGGRSVGGRFIRRAVSITLGLVALLFGTALVVAFTVRVDDAVKAKGVLEPGRVWPVRTVEAGSIREILVQTGDTVARGETVARLDPLLLRSALAELEAKHRTGSIELRKGAADVPLQERQHAELLAQADARLVTARAMLRQRMVENDMGSDVDSLLGNYPVGTHIVLDLAVAEVRSAEAERRLVRERTNALQLSRYERETGIVALEQLEAQIRTVRERLDRLDVPAPASGMVLTEQIERLHGASVREGEVLMEVAEPNQWRLVLYVREGDVHKVRMGDSVKAGIQAFPMDERDQLFGSVVHVATDPTSRDAAALDSVGRPRGGTYRVIAALDPEQVARIGASKFRRGYSVEGRIITRSGQIVELLWDYLQERFEFYWPW